jgi:GT2 family glycosyltransferase
LKVAPLKYEIIVVDNGSTDGSKELVAKKFKSVRLIPLNTNAGFASAINLGVKSSRGQYVALVNNDVEVTRDWLSQLLLALRKNPRIAVVTGKLLFKDKPRIVNDLGGTITLNGAGFQRGLGTVDRHIRRRKLVGVPSGAACLIRKADFLDVGGFDDTYFAYFEDVDLGWRLWQRGRGVAFIPSAVAYHQWRVTAQKLGDQFRVYHGSKNSFANVTKNTQTCYIPEAAILWAATSIMHILPRLATPESTLGTLKALAWCRRNLKPLLAKRRTIQLGRRVTDTKLMELGVLCGLRESLSETKRLHALSPLSPQVASFT